MEGKVKCSKRNSVGECSKQYQEAVNKFVQSCKDTSVTIFTDGSVVDGPV